MYRANIIHYMRLFRPPNFTRTQVLRTSQKLGLRTRAEVVRYALTAGELHVELPAQTARESAVSTDSQSVSYR